MIFSRHEKRKVIVHFHFFKNAGTTVDYIFRNNFPDQVYELEGPDPTSIVTGEAGIEFILKNPNLRVLTSHQLLYPLPKHKDLLIYSIFLLRHPIDRIGSMYHYEKKLDPSSPGSLIAGQLGFKDYVFWRLGGSGRLIQNFQVDKLSYWRDPIRFKKVPLTKKNLNIAKKRLKNNTFFGIVDKFDDTLLYMKNYLEKDFPEIDYSYIIQNQSSDITSLEERLSNIKEQLGTKLYERLLKLNRLDLELYNYGLKLFEARIKKIGVNK
jgi:hypothetical protein